MNIYVGNLSFSVTEEDLRTAFQAYGAVEKAAVISDKMSGQSRGFGFVEMPNKDEAIKAIESLNGKDLKGRNLKVNEAQPRPAGGGGGGGRGGIGGGRGRYWSLPRTSPQGPARAGAAPRSSGTLTRMCPLSFGFSGGRPGEGSSAFFISSRSLMGLEARRAGPVRARCPDLVRAGGRLGRVARFFFVPPDLDIGPEPA